MSGESKTLTPQKCVWKRDPDGDSYVWVIGCTNEFSIQPDAEDYGYCPRCGQDIKLVTAPLEDHEGRWSEAAPSVPVVARDEAAELRAAIKEWVEAKQATDDADRDWTNAIDARADVEGHKATWTRALQREQAAEEALRRLAGGENEK